MILHHPDQTLSQISKPVIEFSEVRQLVDQMLEAMYSGDGVGLAAPQIGELKRVVIVDPSGGNNGRAMRVMINPIIEYSSPAKVTAVEGCLSLPGIQVSVPRSMMIGVKYFNLDGTEHSAILTDLEARISQHEIDHLNGITLMKYVKGRK